MEAVIWSSMIIGFPPLLVGIYLFVRMRLKPENLGSGNGRPIDADVELRLCRLEATVDGIRRALGDNNP